ncbi:coiled-coil domain-containing protein 69 [Festucalex cinctus]
MGCGYSKVSTPMTEQHRVRVREHPSGQRGPQAASENFHQIKGKKSNVFAAKRARTDDKKKSKKGDDSRQDGAKRARRSQRGASTATSSEKCSERQPKILKEVLLADGAAQRAELLKEYADQEVCALVLAILDKVKTETCAQLNDVHQRQRRQTAQQHQQHVHDLDRAHEETKAQLMAKFDASEKQLQVEVSELKAELERYNHLKRRVQESTFKKDLLRNIQAHGSPGAFWESEQESLLFVIEMKSERLREQNGKLQRMEQLAEEKSCADDHLAQTLQQNEDLRVRLDKSQSDLQHACREREEARTSLERHRLMTETLTQEKEQLLFKLKHRDALNMAAATVAPS